MLLGAAFLNIPPFKGTIMIQNHILDRLQSLAAFSPVQAKAIAAALEASPIERNANPDTTTAVLDRLAGAGLLSSQEAQVAAASMLVRKLYNNNAH